MQNKQIYITIFLLLIINTTSASLVTTKKLVTPITSDESQKNGLRVLEMATKNEFDDLWTLVVMNQLNDENKKHVNFNARNNNGDNALIIAARNGFKKIIEALIHVKANLNLQNKEGETALIAASKAGKKEIVLLLIDNYAEINLKDKSHKTALDWATNDKIKKYLTRSELLYAAQKNNEQRVKFLINTGRADVNQVNEAGDNVLIIACRNGNLPIAKFILSKKGTDNKPAVNINYQNKDGETALYEAVYAGKYDLSRLLLKLGADPNIADTRGNTPLLWTLIANNLKLTELLMQHHTIPNFDSANLDEIKKEIYYQQAQKYTKIKN